MIPDDVDDDDAHAVFVHLWLWIDLRFDDDDEGRVGGGLRIVGELADAAGDEDTDVDFAVDGGERLCVTNLCGELFVDRRRRRMWRS